MYYFDGGGVFIYLFDPLTGKLLQVGGYIHSVTLILSYSQDNRLQSIEHSNSGKRLSVNYTTDGLIQSIELLSADNTVEKSK